ncbi:hypothetical protein HX870_01370 [Pseudomonas gingeri]|uniref:Lipoprotein n=1 Tax=Pseudomonas gingeri TaxID=117681 RepID=A0A7Y7XEH4_9PSED|nr:hypothetical protein [Pseudomonas gingeri]NWA28873.1 hypothetical protein [Pseudomonas gingeri]NWB97317.1 hypothetical protein [Pseudomonas gingeri]NWD66270.1 hypothetical protein [Pseudomonas gingeri]
MSSLLRVALVTLALLLTAGCTSKPIVNPSRTLTPQVQASEEEVKQAIVTALTKRTWSVQRVNPGQVQAEITVREKFHVEIDINYSANAYTIVYRDSSGMGYQDGKIHKNYLRWVRFLDQDILAELRAHHDQPTAQAIGVGEAQPLSR